MSIDDIFKNPLTLPDNAPQSDNIIDDNHTPARLTMKSVWDVQEGKEINANDFLKLPESEIINIRRQLQIAISTNSPLLVCPYCHQMVRLSGRKTSRGQVSFFSHLYDSDACHIKTTTGMTKEQIEASKYGLVSESKRHKDLKRDIADFLEAENSKSKGISCVQVEKRINSPLPYLRWRRPDVQAKFNELNLVFELQLSTTFVSTIVDRDLFYRLNNYYIIWIFNFEDNQEYINLCNLMCKDIYYANKRNIFILDKDAQQASRQKGELILKCNWLDPDNTWHFSHSKNNGDGILISLDQLKYDNENYKPYYYDADIDYFKINPDLLEKRYKWEKSREEIVRELIKKETKERDLYEGQDEILRDDARQEMAELGECASTYTKNKRVGLLYKDVILVPPIYASISEYNEYGYAVVENNRHFGLVDRIGNWIIPCEANEILCLRQDIIIYRKQLSWYLVGAQKPIAPDRKYGTISLLSVHELVDCISFGYNDRHAYVLLENRSVFVEEKKGKYLHYDFDGNESLTSTNPIVELNFKETLIFLGYYERLWRKTYYGIYDYDLKEIIAPYYAQTISFGYDGQIIVNNNNRKASGVISKEGTIVIPFEYDRIDFCKLEENPYNVYDHYLIYQKGRKGIANTSGEILIPCIHYNVRPLGVSMFRVRKFIEYSTPSKGLLERIEQEKLRGNPFYRYLLQLAKPSPIYKWGVISKDGKELLPPVYDNIGGLEIENNCFTVTLDSKKGLMDCNLNIIIPCIYNDIKPLGDKYLRICDSFQNEKTGTEQKSKWGIISMNGKRKLSSEYDEIGSLFDDDCFTIKQNRRTGLMNLDFTILIPCIYYHILPWYNGLYMISILNPDYCDYGIGPKFMWGICTKDGKIILPIEFDEIEKPKYDNGFFVVRKNGKKGIIDNSYSIIIPCQYDDISPWGNNLFKVTIIEKNWNMYYYLINTANQRIDNTNYSEIDDLTNGEAISYTTDYQNVILNADGLIIKDERSIVL